MSEAFEVTGSNKAALFTLKLHRGGGMTLLAMNWKKGRPPSDFAGFAIEWVEPGGAKCFPLNKVSSAFMGDDILTPPPRKPDEKAWFEEHYTTPRKARDRVLFA